MRSKLHYTFIFVCFAVFSLNAQTKLSDTAQKVFKEKVIKTANATQSIISNFIQEKHLSILENKVISKGKLAFKTPNRVKWQYTEPYKNTAIFKDDKLFVTNNGKKQTLDLKSNKLFKSLNSLIIGSIKGNMFNDEQFKISYFKNDAGYLVKFTPKVKRLRKFIAEFELHFSKNTAEVEQIKLIEPNADFTLITFINKKSNTQISDEIFKH